ncbi:MAG: dihydrofolate reductase family protein [Candidatus Dormibacteraceae bacterium]
MSGLDPFEVVYEEGGLPGYDLPIELERLYGGLGFAPAALYANFVSSIDGVVSLGSSPSAGSVISGRNRADRFLMGLLRACADAVLLGAGTLRATPGHHWTPQHIFPDMAAAFADLRTRLARKPDPRLVLVTSGGEIDMSHPAVVSGATIITTGSGAKSLRKLPVTCDVIEVGRSGAVDMRGALEKLRSRGDRVILSEGGPHLMGQLVKRGLVDDIFLTVSPVVAGRDKENRLGMVAGVEFLPDKGVWARLAGVRRHGDFLFLRYRSATAVGTEQQRR